MVVFIFKSKLKLNVFLICISIYFFSLIFNLAFTSLYAQNSSLDSLKTEMNKAKNDTTKIDIHLAFSAHFMAQNPDSASIYASEALQLAQKKDDLPRQATALQQLAQAQQFKGNYEDASQFLLEALSLAQKSNSKVIEANVYAGLGAIDYRLGNFDKALTFFLKALKIYEKTADKKGQAKMNNNIGNLYFELEDNEKALNYAEKTLKIKKEIGDTKTIGNTYDLIGNIMSATKKPDEALNFYQKAIESHEKNQNMRGLASVNTNIGYLYWELQKYPEALTYYQKSLEIDKKTGNQQGVAINLLDIGSVYKDNNQLAEAEENVTKALEILKTLNMKNEVQKTLKDLADIQAERGNHKQGFETLKNYILVKDSVFSEKKNEQITEMQTKYETEKKEQENKLLQAQNERKKILLYASVAFIMVLIGLALAIFRVKQLQLKNTRTKILLQEQELISQEQELINFAQNLIEKDDLIAEIQEQLELLEDKQNHSKVENVEKLLQTKISTENDWLKFRQNFEQIYPHFFNRLQNRFPQLSSNELKICAIEKLGLKDLQAGDILGVNPSSVKKSRYRLRKNLDEKEQNELQSFLLTYPTAK